MELQRQSVSTEFPVVRKTVVMRLVVALYLLTAADPSWAADATITDADTLVLDGTAYRLDGINAPETDQVCLEPDGAVWSCGIEAREQLRTFVGNRVVRCDAKGTDPVYRTRRIAVCWVEGESVSLNQWLVREGWAINYEPYAKGRFKSDEDAARTSRSGLWRGCFSSPQDMRNWAKKTARLLGATCPRGNDGPARDLLFRAHPAMPAGCTIKGRFAGRARFTGHRGIYHLENCKSYRRTTKSDRWFCSELEAQAEGFRKAFTCN